MNEVEFRSWMDQKAVNRKVQSDLVSRLKKIERELDHCDLDAAYCKDKCRSVMALFLNKGENDGMKKYPNAQFPIGQYYMSTFRYAVKQYVLFCDSVHTR